MAQAPPRTDLRAIILAIAAASVEVAEAVSLGRLSEFAFKGLSDGPANGVIAIETGLAVQARRTMVQHLHDLGVRDVACVDRLEPYRLDEDGLYTVALDPLDGASNADTNMALGTIFSIAFAADPTRPRLGTTQLAAGFIVYGPQTNLVLTLGDGVDVFTLDRRDALYRLSQSAVRVPLATQEYAIDASNYRHWPSAVRSLINDHLEDSAEPGGQTCNMRWVGSLVAEAYRILMRGGVFLCPADKRRGHETGCRQLTSAAHPIALVMEQAGAAASTGYMRILERQAPRLDERTPLIFGSRDLVERIERLHALPERFAETSPLFGKRGLFRN